MAEFDWSARMRQWNDLIWSTPLSDDLPEEARAGKWLGRPGATEGQIVAAETRLGIPLPPSYRSFLQLTNGWGRVTSFIDRLWSSDEVRWFKQENKDWIRAFADHAGFEQGEPTPDDEYFSYVNPEDFRWSHLKETLQISEVGDAAVYLLNPQVIDQHGEWEAWFFATWIPGAVRFRSFQEMLEAHYQALIRSEWQPPVGVVGELPNEYTGAPGSAKRKLKKRRRPRAVKILGKQLDQWDFDELVALLKHEDIYIRCEAVEGLEKLKDSRAIEPLLELLDPGQSGIEGAMHALFVSAPDRLRTRLLEILRKPELFKLSFTTAVNYLVKMQEMAAVPYLVKAVKDTSKGAQIYSNPASAHLSQFGTVGLDALELLLSEDVPVIRLRAASGLMYSSDPRAADIYRKLLADPDSQVRETAETGLKVLNRRP